MKVLTGENKAGTATADTQRRAVFVSIAIMLISSMKSSENRGLLL
jgi:hypothetical protein